MKNSILKTFIFILLITSINTNACSAFCFKHNGTFFAKNFDWYSGDGYLIKNNKNQLKFAYGLNGDKQASWTSKYGSLTFNQIGKEFPYGGMNEKGLVVEVLWFNSSFYKDNNNAAISELEWVQYQLDNYKTVEEVLAHINELTINPIAATLHYMIADKNGNSVVIDFIEGKLIASKNKTNLQVVTNTSYPDLENYYNVKGSTVDINSRSSKDRYCQIINNINHSKTNSVQNIFDILQASSENKKIYKTYWSIVYDLENLEIHFKSFNNTNVKTVNFSDFSFNKHEPIIASEINLNKTDFKPFTSNKNKNLLKTAIKNFEVELDLELANDHQMNPNKLRIDSIYQANYANLVVEFTIKKEKGMIHFTIMNGEDNFNKRNGFKGKSVLANKDKVRVVFYAVPKGEYALASFHDLNTNYKLDSNLFGIPNEPYAFSNNAKGFMGLPPKYEHAKFQFQKNDEIFIQIK